MKHPDVVGGSVQLHLYSAGLLSGTNLAFQGANIYIYTYILPWERLNLQPSFLGVIRYDSIFCRDSKNLHVSMF